MSVVGSAQLRQGFPRAEFSLTGRKYTVQWLVTVDSYADGPAVAQSASGLPAAFDTYAFGSETDIYARIREWSAYRLEDNSLVWVVEAVYSTPEPKGGDNTGTGQGTATDTAGSYDNPLLELPTVKTFPVQREVPITRIFNLNTGLYNAPRNSACEIFNPPAMKKDNLLGLTISRNEVLNTVHPALGVQYQTAVNSNTFWGLAAGIWQCQSIIAERQTKQIQGGSIFAYLKVEYTFHAKWDGWDVFVLDAGNYYCGGSGSGSGAEPSLWCEGPGGEYYYCGGSGSGSGAPVGCPGCTTKTAFQDRQGHPIKGTLDGRGGRLPDNANPVWIWLRPYPRLSFSALSLPQSFAACQ